LISTEKTEARLLNFLSDAGSAITGRDDKLSATTVVNLLVAVPR